MRQETIEIYKIDELESEAKQKAIDSFKENHLNYKWYDFIYDDAKEIAQRLGIEIKDIYFSGFSSQGDGAQFVGRYSYEKDCLNKVKDYAPQDTELHRIAKELQEIQKHFKYTIRATVEHSGHYYHEYCTNIFVEAECESKSHDAEYVAELLRDFMRWIYKMLETEYEYLMSDEQIEEHIRINEYEFTVNGEMH